MVDDADFEWINQYKWHACVCKKTVYAKRSVKVGGKWIGQLMHRFIMGINDPKILVDHIKGNGLDNRRESIRLCNVSQNGMNSDGQVGSSSRFKGVSWNKRCVRWEVSITINRKIKHVGLFDSEIEAAAYYNKLAKEHRPDFSRYNDVPELHDGYVLTKKILPKNNASGFRGVSRFGNNGKWQVKTKAGGKHLFIGVFDDLIEAAMAYDVKAKEVHGISAVLNFPEEK